MSTRSSILYGGKPVLSLDEEEVQIEPSTHIWHELLDDCVYVEVSTDHLEISALHDTHGNVAGTRVIVKLPKNTSAAICRAFGVTP